MAGPDSVLTVEGLRVHFRVKEGVLKAVDGVSFELKRGRTLGLVGESGSGKTVTALSLLRLVEQPPAEIKSGSVLFEGRDLLTLDDAGISDVRGRAISMIFQEPMTSLNPVQSIGRQIDEALIRHLGLPRERARARTCELLELVGIPNAARNAGAYPHQFSGGMRQRAMIAMAIACDPRVLIADEPTTALDVTIQAQILELIVGLQDKLGTAILLITHDLAVIAETAHDVAVMYAGRIVESGPVKDVFEAPRHPYTQGLLRSIPHIARERLVRLNEIPGVVPSLARLPPGCAFAARCELAEEHCRREPPELRARGGGRRVACWRSADA